MLNRFMTGGAVALAMTASGAAFAAPMTLYEEALVGYNPPSIGVDNQNGSADYTGRNAFGDVRVWEKIVPTARWNVQTIDMLFANGNTSNPRVPEQVSFELRAADQSTSLFSDTVTVTGGDLLLGTSFQQDQITRNANGNTQTVARFLTPGTLDIDDFVLEEGLTYWMLFVGRNANASTSFLATGENASSGDGMGFIGYTDGAQFSNRVRDANFDVQMRLNGEVAPVPLPAAAWMLIAGVGALAAAGRRRKA